MKSLSAFILIMMLIYGCEKPNKPVDNAPCLLPEIGWEGWANIPA